MLGTVSLLACTTFAWFMRKPQTRKALRAGVADYLHRLPQVGDRLRALSWRASTWRSALCWEGGLPILAALELCDGLVSAKTQLALQQAMRRIGEGQPTSTAFDEAGLAAPRSRCV